MIFHLKKKSLHIKTNKKMKIIKNIPIQGKHKRSILTDLFYTENKHPKNLVIFCHGYKGFKDWGAWNLVAEEFANNNLFFVKFNFSHNGGTLEQPIDFPDLEAFGNNNFIKELDDLNSVIDYLIQLDSIKSEININKVSLIGHSRGGGIVLLKAREDNRISKVVTWAGVSDFALRFPSGALLKNWKEKGIAYITNVRTNQQMPHYIQFYTTFKENENRLTIKNAVRDLEIPYLIVHGTNDETVSLEEAKNLNNWNSKSELFIIENGNHSFGSMQPWTNDVVPNDLKKAISKTIPFILE